MAEGKPEQRRCRGGSADGGDPPGAKALVQAVARQGGKDGAGGNDHRNAARPGNLRPQLRVHGGPCRAQQGVRQTKADKRQINDWQKQRCHGLILLLKIIRDDFDSIIP